MKNAEKMLNTTKNNPLYIMRLLMTAWLFSFTYCSNAQQPDMLKNWVTATNGGNPFSGNAYGMATTADNAGNFYVTGFFNGTVDFDPGAGAAPLTSAGGADIFFAKYDYNGNYVLAKSVGGTDPVGDYGWAIAVDASNNIIIGGEFSGTVDFDPGLGVASLTGMVGSGRTDAYVAKYDATGNFLFVNHIYGGDYTVVRGLTVDASGNIVVAGYFWAGLSIVTGGGTSTLANNGAYDSFLIKFTSGGNTIFSKHFGNYSFDNGYAVATDAAGNIYIAGVFIASIDLGAGFISPPAGGNYDVWVGKFSSTGTYIYGKVFGGPGEDWCNGLTVDAGGNAYIAGYFNNTVDFDPGFGTASFTSAGGKDAYLLKLDNNGNYLYANTIGGTTDDYAFGVAADANNNIYVTGAFSGTTAVDFDPGAGVVNLTCAGNNDAYIAKYNSSGGYIYARNFNAATGEDVGTAIVAYGNYNVFATGYFSDVADLDPEAGVYNLGTAGTFSAYMLRLTKDYDIAATPGSNGTLTPSGTTLVLAETNQLYNITPNAGYCIADVLVDGASVGAVSTYTFTNVIASHTITATFTPAPHWYKDNDGDGYGNFSNDSIACTQPVGYLSDNTDCNDNSNLEHPGQTWFTDADGDGYGTGANVTQCLRPVGGKVVAELISTTGDCNDNSNTVYPGAPEITCNGIDENCNGMADDGTPSLPATSITSDAAFNEICNGNQVNLSVNGGLLGVNANWYWYENSCGGSSIGTGSSITVNPSSNKTYYVRAESICNITQCVQISISVKSLAVTSLPLMPFTGMPGNVCNSTVAALSIPSVSRASFYVWDAPAGSYFNGNVLNVSPFTTTTPSVTVTFGNPNGSLYSVGVQAGNACGSSIRQSQKVRGLTSVPLSIGGSLTACLSSTGTYSTPAVVGASSYLWTITGDATVSGTGTTVTVNFGPTWTGGTLCVASQTSCYTSATKCVNITTSASTLSPISGTFTACPNTTITYSVPASAGAASYTWTLPPGATGNSATNNINVSFGPGYNAVGSICVSATSICGVTSAPKCKTIAPGLPSQPNSITGPANGLCGQSVVYTCPSQGAGVTYTWTVPSGASIISGQGSTSINVQYGTFTTGSVCVTANNSCGSSTARCIGVKGAPATPGAITAIPSSWCANTSGIEFDVNVANISGSYVLSWTYPSSTIATYVLGAGNSTSLLMDWLVGSGNINVTASNACGSGTKTSTWSSTCREGETTPVNSLSVSPNPTSAIVNISYHHTGGNTMLKITDLAGRTVMMQNRQSISGKNQTQINMSKLAKGSYLLTVQTSIGIQSVKIMLE